MAHFNADFHAFFAGLEAHNDREWYADHKAQYEQHVRDPFKTFVTQVIEACAAREPEFDGVEAKHCVFRIHRDTRFSKDKTPYKTHCSANIAAGGKKSGDPGLYVHADAHTVRIGGGAYWVEKDDLYVLRERIANHPQTFNDLMAESAFVSHYGTVLGERNVRLPKEFQSAAQVCPHILNKQFYYMAELPADTLLRDDLLDIVMAHFEAAAPLRSFLREGLRAG
jgi:uncharacterized protein (TIGR02453 family)